MIDGWGVGTKLVTAYDQPALGGVYKMGAICPEDGKWRGRVKLSEQAAKISNPGAQQIRRFIRQNEYIADMIFDELHGPPKSRVLVDIADITIRRRISDSAAFRDLLAPIFRKGKMVYNRPSIHQSRDYARTELGLFYSGVKRLLNSHVYPVGLEIGLHEEKARLIEEARCSGAQKSHSAERGRDLPG
jgi:nicotinate phosphoribosyltransferase